MNELFKGVCPVINVPFNENEEVDYKGLEKLIDFSYDSGCKSLCLFAFNSEPHKIGFNEKKDIIKAFIKNSAGRMLTLIGIVENSLTDCIELAKHSEKCGADGLILYPPALSTPSGDQLCNYFKKIADSVNIAIMIQDNPRSTGVSMSLEFLIDTYKKISNFRHLKVECPFPMRKMKKINALTNGEMKCYSGNGGIFAIDAFLSGANGIMPGIVAAKYFIKMYDYFESGQLDKARNLFEKILPFAWYEDQSLEFYIACEKAVLKYDGIIDSDKVREPGCVLTEAEYNELIVLYERLKSFFVE